MASGSVSVEKNAGSTLTIGDRIDIIKGKRAFPLVFPLLMLLLMIVLFGIITGGDFFRIRIMKGIFNQSIITGTIATAVCFIFATGNIDFSVGSVMGLSARV